MNDFNCAALGNAIRKHNWEAVKMIGKRPDLIVRAEDEELAREHGINLSDFIKPQPMELSEESTKSKMNIKMENFDFDLKSLFEEAFKVRA